MVKILTVIFPGLAFPALGITDPKVAALLVVFGIMVLTASISVLSGLWGVLVTDLIQFVLKMGMVIVLAYFAVKAVGGMDGLREGLHQAGRRAGRHGSVLSFVPDIGSAWMPLLTFFVYIAVTWWATWYPGAEPGGGGYVAQRMFSAKDERHSLLATLWFEVAHYALRPWPWILAALASLVLYPTLDRQGDRLHPADGRSERVPAGAARADGGGLRGGLHVHGRDPAQLGGVVPHQRCLQAVLGQGGRPSGTTSGPRRWRPSC